MKRPSCAFMAIVLVAGALAALSSGAWAAAPIEHDEKRSIEQGQFLRLYYRTHQCMRQGAVAMLRHGERDGRSIQAFMRASCGTPLRTFLVTTGSTNADADAVLRLMAEKTLEAEIVAPAARPNL